jgi:hypothetical protein
MAGNIDASGRCFNNGELMLWLAEHMGKVGEEIRNEMCNAEERVEAMNDMSDLKTALNDYLQGNHPEDLAEIEAFLAKHADNPFLKDVVGLLTEASSALKSAINEEDAKFLPGWVAKVNQTIPAAIGAMQSKIDGLAKDDQLGMIRLQDATSRSNQAMQMASSVMASRNGAALAVIGNIRG